MASDRGKAQNGTGEDLPHERWVAGITNNQVVNTIPKPGSALGHTTWDGLNISKLAAVPVSKKTTLKVLSGHLERGAAAGRSSR